MAVLIRLIMFSVCAVAGVAAAFSVALRSDLETVGGENDGPSAIAPADPLIPEIVARESSPPPAAEFTPSDHEPESSARISDTDRLAPAIVRSPVTIEPGGGISREPPPVVAPYHPPVADPLGLFRDVLERIQAKQEQTEQALSRIEQDLPRSTASTLPELPPAPPPAVTEQPLPPPKPRIESGEGDYVEIELANADLREVLGMLSSAGSLNILASPSVTGTVTASLTGVGSQAALDAILKSTGFAHHREGGFLFIGTPEELRSMEQLGARIRTRVYRPNYVTAAELQQLVTPMLSSQVGTVTVSSPAEVGVPADEVNVGGDAFAGEEVLIVRDYEGVLAEIDAIVAEVDVMPLQVILEATILSVRLGDRTALGVDFELLRQRDSIRVVSGMPLNSLVTADLREGLKIGFLDTSLLAFVEALETIGDTSVVASPRVMCLNKQRAEILIGSELGYVSTTVTETAATQTVEFLEVGTHLRIRPFISNDGMIRLEVHPELSEGSVRVEQGLTLPDKDVTQVTTNIMCQSGATVVIGGLIREDLATTATQIPVLGNLPMVGTLFRQRTEQIDRREIIVLLTPKIVDVDRAWADGASASRQMRDRRNVFLDKMSPLGKRHHGERYLRLASAAWAAGDADAALRYVNLSLHWDPLHQAAVNLRQEILAFDPTLEQSVDEHLRRGLGPLQDPHRDYSRAGYPWQPLDERPTPGIWEGDADLQPVEPPGQEPEVGEAERDGLPPRQSVIQPAAYFESKPVLRQPFGIDAQVSDQR